MLQLPYEIENIIYNYIIIIREISKETLSNQWKFLSLDERLPTRYWKLCIPSLNLNQCLRAEFYSTNGIQPNLIQLIELYMLNIVNYRNYINSYNFGIDSVHNYVTHCAYKDRIIKKERKDCINHLLWIRQNFDIFNTLINRFRYDIDINIYNVFYYLPKDNRERYIFSVTNDDINRIRTKNMQLFMQSLKIIKQYDFTPVFNRFSEIFSVKSLYDLRRYFEIFDIDTLLRKLNKDGNEISFNQLKMVQEYLKHEYNCTVKNYDFKYNLLIID